MAMKIQEECINCGSCEADCPNEAIKAADPTYTIDSGKCTHCRPTFDTPRCVETCPIEGCIVELA